MSYIVEHLAEVNQILQKLDIDSIERMTDILAETRKTGGRLFILGVGGSAANGLAIKRAMEEVETDLVFMCHNDVAACHPTWMKYLYDKIIENSTRS